MRITSVRFTHYSEVQFLINKQGAKAFRFNSYSEDPVYRLGINIDRCTLPHTNLL